MFTCKLNGDHKRTSAKCLFAIVVAATAIAGAAAHDWQGFHGLQKQGRSDSAAGPVNWSSSQNVLWKTAIPGRGHSSPILSGNAVYLTTTYRSSRRFPIQIIWNHAIFVLTLLLTITGITFAVQELTFKQSKRNMLDLDDRAIHSWLIATMLVICCLVLSLLFVPLRSRRQLAASLASVIFTVPAFLALKHRGLVLSVGSLEGIAIAVVLISPLVFGLALLTAHLLSRKRSPVAVQSRDDPEPAAPVLWHYLITGIKPDVGWWCIGLYTALVFITITRCFLKSNRRPATAAAPLRAVVPVIALTLGAAFFVYVNFVEKPKEFVRAVLCLSRDTGRILWTREALLGQSGGRGRTVTHASPTPATDGERIYAYFGEDGLVCLSTEGELLWKETEPMFRGKFGVGTSPVVKDNVLIVVADLSRPEGFPSSITAFDSMTGDHLWSKERKSHRVYAAYGTPLIKSLNGRNVVIVHGWHDVKGYNLKTGRELWSYPITHEGRHLVASLVSDRERLYVIGTKKITALNLSKLETGRDPLLWSSPIAGEKSSTPVVVDGLIFVINESGMASCLDADTGETLWQKRLAGRYYSSVTAVGNHILFTSEAGRTTVVAAAADFRQIAKNALAEPVYTSLAPAPGRLFVRTTKHLYCIREDQR